MRASCLLITLIRLVGFTSIGAQAQAGGPCGGFYGGPFMYYGPSAYYQPARVYAARPMYDTLPAPAYGPPRGQPAYGAAPSYAPPASAAPAYGRGPQPQGRTAPAATIVEVGAYDNRFEPQTINVPPGTTVRWTNRGSHPHTVSANDGRWDSGDIALGATYAATFQQPGAYYYYCRHHQQDRMQGTLVVGDGGAAPGGRPGGAR